MNLSPKTLNKNVLTVLAFCLIASACSDESEQGITSQEISKAESTPAKDVVAKVIAVKAKEVKKTTPQATEQATNYVTNSDGSKTAISGIAICPKDIPKEAKTQGCSWQGSSISFYADGKNFVSIDEDSLVLEMLSINGINHLKNRKQESNYDLGSFPKATGDGKYLQWKINITDGYNSPKAKIAIKGHLNAFVSEKLIESTSELFDYQDFSSFTLGPLTIKGTRPEKKKTVDNFFSNDTNLNEEDRKLIQSVINVTQLLDDKTARKLAQEMLTTTTKSPERVELLMGKLIEYSLAQAFSQANLGQQNATDKFDLTTVSESSVIDRVEVYSDNKKLQNSSSWSQNNSKTYSMEKPTSKQVLVKVFYWQKPTSVKINIDF